MVDTELAYAAGLFDGEGSISLVRQKTNRSHSPQVSVASNDYEVLAWFQNALVAVCHQTTSQVNSFGLIGLAVN